MLWFSPCQAHEMSLGHKFGLIPCRYTCPCPHMLPCHSSHSKKSHFQSRNAVWKFEGDRRGKTMFVHREPVSAGHGNKASGCQNLRVQVFNGNEQVCSPPLRRAGTIKSHTHHRLLFRSKLPDGWVLWPASSPEMLQSSSALGRDSHSSLCFHKCTWKILTLPWPGYAGPCSHSPSGHFVFSWFLGGRDTFGSGPLGCLWIYW